VSAEPLDGWNLRVYGLLIENGWILLSRETYPDFKGYMNKLPGGGIRLGEGPGDALKREFHEEVGIEVELTEIHHLPTYFLRSYFENSQILPFYFLVNRETDQIPKYMNNEIIKGVSVSQEFYWARLEDLHPDMMTFPFDKEALEKLLVSMPQNSQRTLVL
jgi:8-oxo-dGTP diphosphatase